MLTMMTTSEMIEKWNIIKSAATGGIEVTLSHSNKFKNLTKTIATSLTTTTTTTTMTFQNIILIINQKLNLLMTMLMSLTYKGKIDNVLCKPEGFLLITNPCLNPPMTVIPLTPSSPTPKTMLHPPSWKQT